jgi:hypothetical protein
MTAILEAPARVRSLDKLQRTVGRYVVLSEAQRLVVALWIVHTYVAPILEQTPYLSITSPEKGCGKSRLLDVLERLVAKPWKTFDASAATLYHKISSQHPTMLLDETDAIFGSRPTDRQEALRAIINSGHRHGATVDRWSVQLQSNESFSVYCPKALAGIGTLPDTIADRSIPIRMQRRTRAEPLARFFERSAEDECAPIREAIKTWAIANAETILYARPDMPEELSDRMQEGCESLFAIADLLDYGVEARAALVELLTAVRVDSDETWQLKLLEDMRTMFEAKGERTLQTMGIVVELHAYGWDEYGHGLDGTRLAKLLRPYGIRSRNVRNEEGVAKGYHSDDFEDAWSRYLLPMEVEAVPDEGV